MVLLHLLLLLLVKLSQAEDVTVLEMVLADLETGYIPSEVNRKDLKPVNVKCPLSQLHRDMEKFRTAEYQTLPRLADLRVKYPGERFTRLKGSWCDNVSF